MSLNDEIKFEHRAAEITDLAMNALTTELGLTSSEAAKFLFVAAARNMTASAINEATRNIRPKGAMPFIG